MKNLKVIHLSENDKSGGSAFYANRVHKHMLRNKIKSMMYVLNKDTQDKNVKKFFFKKNSNLVKKINFLSLNERNKYSFYNLGKYVINKKKQIEPLFKEKPNSIIIYNNSNFLSPRIVNYLINKNIKVFFYLMDMELITGGCHYNFNCMKFKKDCHPCPATRLFLKNQAKKNLFFKKKNLSFEKLNFISPNKKIFSDVYKSSIFNKSKHNNYMIYLGLDLKKYKPSKKKGTKKISICFRSSLNPRKGNIFLINALNYLILKDKDIIDRIHFDIVGDSSITEFLKKKKFTYDFKGTIENENELINFYNKNDFFLNQSIQDAGPVMVNEALACGTPVISFRNGVSVDVIRNGYNGFLISKISSELLAKKINEISFYRKKKISSLVKNSRKTAKNYFNIKNLTQELIKLCQ